MILRHKKLVSIFPLVMLLMSCGGGGGGGSGSGASDSVPQGRLEEVTKDGVVTFNELNSTIISPKCLRCHSQFAQESGLRPHVVAGNPEGSRLFSIVRSGEMPREGNDLTTQELEVVRTYIESTSTSSALRE